MRNNMKVNRYWVCKNRIFFKRMNFNEDQCMWEGWQIHARTSDPYYKNIVLIVLRRKFLPPFFDKYQNFHFMLFENCSREFYTLNPKALQILELAANSIFYSSQMNEKEYDLFIKSKIDSLLVDEESLYFYQNTLNLVGEDVYSCGYRLLICILRFLEYNTKDKEKIKSIRMDIDKKISLFNDLGLGSRITTDDIDNNNKQFKAIIDEIKELYNDEEKETEEEKEEESHHHDDHDEPEEETPQISNQAAINKKREEESQERERKRRKDNWICKCYRFLSYCINGGLSDFAMTFELFIDFTNRCQVNVNDLNEFIFDAMNLRDLENPPPDDNAKLSIPSLNNKSRIVFNEEIVCICIRKGWLSKYLYESVKHTPTFIKLLISKYCSNKILSATHQFLKYINEQTGEEGANGEERKALSMMISTLVEIYADTRRCPMTLTLVAKCLCALIANDSDKKNKIILIQEDIVPKISIYFEHYDYDEKLLVTSLEILYFVLPELKLKVIEYLSGVHNVNLIKSFKNFLKDTKVPGTYYSQRVFSLI